MSSPHVQHTNACGCYTGNRDACYIDRQCPAVAYTAAHTIAYTVTYTLSHTLSHTFACTLAANGRIFAHTFN